MRALRFVSLASLASVVSLASASCSLAIGVDDYAGGDAATAADGDATFETIADDADAADAPDATNDEVDAVGDLSDEAGDAPDAVADLSDEAADASDAVADLPDEVADAPDALADSVDAADDVHDAAVDVADGAVDVHDATVDAHDAESDARDALADTHDASPDVHDAAVDAAVDATVDASDAPADANDAALDSADASVLDAIVAEADGSAADGGCTGVITSVGISEVMPAGVIGSDGYEWVELTNFGAGCVDVGGLAVVVQTLSNAALHPAPPLPTGTTLAAGESLIIVDDLAKFTAALTPGYALGQAFEFGAGITNQFSNAGFHITLTASGAVAPYEDVQFAKSAFPGGIVTPGQSFAFGADPATCAGKARLDSTTTPATPTSAWTAYMSAPYLFATAAATPQYGTPTQPNVGLTCP